MIRYKDFSRIVLLAALVALPACASRPAPRIFVLDPPGGAPTGIVSLRDRPQVALLAVQVPDYLDTTDILTRGTGHEIVASDSARWGERLSVGVTHAVLSALQARRQDLGIAPADSIDNRPRRLLVQIDALDLWSDGRCTLTARWSLLDHDGETVLVESPLVTKPIAVQPGIQFQHSRRGDDDDRRRRSCRGRFSRHRRSRAGHRGVSAEGLRCLKG